MAGNFKDNGLSDIDPRLLEEAFKRARQVPLNKDIDSDSLLSAIFAEARRGTRDMHGLCGAAAKAPRASVKAA